MKLWMFAIGFIFVANLKAMDDDELPDLHTNACVLPEQVNTLLPQIVSARIKNKKNLDGEIICSIDKSSMIMVYGNPLSMSVSSDNFLPITKRLLRHHANPHISKSLTSEFSWIPPLRNAYYNNAKRTFKTLLKAGTDPNLNRNSDGHAILHLVCLGLKLNTHKPNYQEYVNNQIKIVKLLLQYGADPNLRDIYGRIPLFQLYFRYFGCD